MEDKLYTCLGCGLKVFKKVFSEYEICPICYWQDASGGMGKPWRSPYVGVKENLYDDYQQKILKKYLLM